MPATPNEILTALTTAYNMEVETIVNYLSISLDLDGVRADFIKQALAADILGELNHARQIGNRIKQLGGSVPGSQQLKMSQSYLQPPSDTTDRRADRRSLAGIARRCADGCAGRRSPRPALKRGAFCFNLRIGGVGFLRLLHRPALAIGLILLRLLRRLILGREIHRLFRFSNGGKYEDEGKYSFNHEGSFCSDRFV